MALTGWPNEAPLGPAAPVIERAEHAATELARWTATWGRTVGPDVGPLLFGRAALLGLGRQGRTSAGGSCRLLRALDGWLAVNLARPDDLDAVPAVVCADAGTDPWVALARGAAAHNATVLADRAQLLGISAAALPASAGTGIEGRLPFAETAGGTPYERSRPPTVVDLSAMWAGPLCARLLGWAGARVIHVESTGRPDGARFGHPGFWTWLHRGQQMRNLDLTSPAGAHELARLVSCADVVIEASRPRALRQLGLDAEELVRAQPGLTWLSITGYGRDEGAAQRVAFGDDAAVAGGLVAYDRHGDPVFCGDAIADPLSGLVAAAAVARSIATGGGRLIEVSMRDVAAWAGAPGPLTAPFEVTGAGAGTWVVRAGSDSQAVLDPPLPPRHEAR